MKDYELKISQLIDNELPTEEEQELFLFLAENEEGRRIFADFMDMKKEAKLYYAGITTELNEPKIIAANLSDKKEHKYKMPFYYSVAAAILLAIMLTSNFIKENPFETKYENLQAEFVILQNDYSNALNEKAELINMNKWAVQQRDTLKLNYEEFVKQTKKNIDKQVRAKLQSTYGIGNEYLSILAEIPTVKLTEDDYLIQ